MSESCWDRMEACAMQPGLGTAGRQSRECPGVALFMWGAPRIEGAVCGPGPPADSEFASLAHTTLAHGGFCAAPHPSQVTQRGYSHPLWDPHFLSLKRSQVENGSSLLRANGDRGQAAMSSLASCRARACFPVSQLPPALPSQVTRQRDSCND